MTKAAAGVITHEVYRRTSLLFWRHTTSCPPWPSPPIPTAATGDLSQQSEAESQGRVGEADDDRAGAQQPCPVAMSASAQAAKHPGGKRHRGIPALSDQPGSEADTLGHLGLRPPFSQAARTKI